MILQILAASESVRSFIFFLIMSSRTTSDMALRADDPVLWSKQNQIASLSCINQSINKPLFNHDLF